MKIATLGPKGTFSELACEKYQEKAGKGEIVFCKNLKEVFDLVNSKKTDVGIAPLENLLDGSVGETLDLLYKSDLNIIRELVIEIHHCIAGLSYLKDVKTVLSHPKALGQCLEHITRNKFETRETVSTAEAMKIVSKNKNKELAAIGTEIAAKEYGLKILEKNIEDKDNNVTRFAVISRNKSIKEKGKEYKTSIVVHLIEDRPGLLYDLLKPFSIRKINLTKIESRPTKITLGEYIFYIDLKGHEQDKDVRDALNEVKKLAKLKILGSYERVY